MTANGFQSGFVAELLRAEAGAIAARAARLMEDRGVAVGGERLGAWRESLEARVREVSAAIAADQPHALAERVAWARTAYEARGVGPAELVASLHAVKQAAMEAVPREDRVLVASVMEGALLAAERAAGAPPAELPGQGRFATLAGRYLLAILEGDRLRAGGLLLEAVRGGVLDVAEAYEGVLAPVLKELGRMWHLGEVSVAEEHFGTATTLMVMSQLSPLAERKAANGRAVVACSVEGDLHEVGVRMVSDRFEWEGWRVVYLGASVPAEDVGMAVADFGAEAVLLSASLVVHVDAMERAIAAVRGVKAGVCVVVGGAGLGGDEALAKRLGADGMARGPREAVGMAGAWLDGRSG